MRIKPFVFILIVFLTYSCSGEFGSGSDEGCIDYDIKYMQSQNQNPLISLLPKTMSFKFKDNSTVQRIEGWMEVFIMAGITNAETQEKSAFLKILNNKFYYATNLNGPTFGFDKFSGMKIEYVESETKVVAGYLCKKADITFSNKDIPPFSVYYTNEIDIKEPNLNNPFSSIDGVLLEYQMIFQGIPMCIVANKVEFVNVEDEEFEIPTGYEKVPMETMIETINELM